MLSRRIVLIIILLCSWAILLHAEVSRDLPGTYRNAFDIDKQDSMQVRENTIRHSTASPADFKRVVSYAYIPVPAAFGGAKCSFNTLSLTAPGAFEGAISFAELSKSSDFMGVAGYSITPTLITPDAFKGVTSFEEM